MIRHQMNNQETQLMTLLQTEIGRTRDLFDSLELESEALVARDTAALEKVTENKLAQVRQLESLGQQRETLLTTIEGDPLYQHSQLSSVWQELLSLAKQCQQKNRINGSIIEVGFRQSQQALDILQGTSSKPELYNNAGQTTRSAKTGTLAQA